MYVSTAKKQTNNQVIIQTSKKQMSKMNAYSFCTVAAAGGRTAAAGAAQGGGSGKDKTSKVSVCFMSNVKFRSGRVYVN